MWHHLLKLLAIKAPPHAIAHGWVVCATICKVVSNLWQLENTPSLRDLLQASNSCQSTVFYIGTCTYLFSKHRRLHPECSPPWWLKVGSKILSRQEMNSLCSSCYFKERRKDGGGVATGMNYSGASVSSWSNSPCNTITRITSSLCIVGCILKEKDLLMNIWYLGGILNVLSASYNPLELQDCCIKVIHNTENFHSHRLKNFKLLHKFGHTN